MFDFNRHTCKYCGHSLSARSRVAPTGNKDISVLVRKCIVCDCMASVFDGKSSYKEEDWLKRWNRRSLAYYKKV